MSISFLTPARTVLLIGDDALCVFKTTHNAAKLLDTVPWQADGFEDIVVGLIKKQGGGKPVLILNDMTDQHFKGGQRIPKVGVMDKANVLKRKLMVAFPNYPIRGALPVKNKPAKGADVPVAPNVSGDLYLFAAIPFSEPIAKTFDAVKRSMASIAGFALLPVESSDMVRALAEKAAGAKKATRWTVFIGQHRNGALRQVIVRDGQLAMTRMTPVGSDSSNPAAWAAEVAQEFKATVSYLSRFGFTPNDGTDLIVVGDIESANALESLVEIPCNYYNFSAAEAARHLGMRIGVQEEAGFAEPLHVAWAGRKTKFILPMEATDLDRIHKPRQAVAAAMFLLVLAGGYLGWQLASGSQEMLATRDDLSVQKTVLAQAEADYQTEVERMERLGFDVKLIQNSISTFEEFEADRLDVMGVLRGIGTGLGKELRLDELDVRKVAAGGYEEVDGQRQVKSARLEAVLSLSFPSTIQPEDGIREMNDLQQRLSSALSGYEVAITKQVARPEYYQNLKGVAADKTAQQIAAEEDYVAELMIRGPNK